MPETALILFRSKILGYQQSFKIYCLARPVNGPVGKQIILQLVFFIRF